MTIVFFRKIVERVARVAPKVTFELTASEDEPNEPVRRGEIDFLVFPEVFMSNEHPKAALFDEPLVCVGCRPTGNCPTSSRSSSTCRWDMS